MHAALIVAVIAFMPAQVDPSLLTVAEASDYTATATSAQVMELVERIAARSEIMRVSELGRTVEDRPIPLILLSNPPVNSVQDAVRSSADNNKLICFVMANIHAGEVEGKEACLMLAREVACESQGNHPLLRDLIIIIAPNYNADGNDRFDDVAKNRPGQIGPVQCGVRPNAQGFDLNRDYVKLDAPESRSLVKFLNDCDPHLTIDCHTTNGSHHRYVLTYDGPLNPSGHAAPIHFVRNELLPEVTKRIKERTGYDMWFYGNFNREHTVWETYSAQPRFGGPYQGLRNQMSILSEAYSYAPFKDRVIATREFVREILQFATERKDEIKGIHERARREVTEAGANPQPHDTIGIRHRVAAFDKPVLVKGYERAVGGEGGAAADPHADLGSPKDFLCQHNGRFEATLSVQRPFGYVIPPGHEAVVERLQQHGIKVEPFAGEVIAEVYTVTSIDRAEREFQKHRTVSVQAMARHERRRFEDGSTLVRTAQPLGTLVVYLLEPMSEDGLVTWNYFDDRLEMGGEFPVIRVGSMRDLKGTLP